MTEYRTEQLASADGTALHLHRWGPEQPAARMLVLHGRGEHGGRYAELGSRLAELNMAIEVPDLRGFGRSGGRRGSVCRFEEYLGDLRTTLAHLGQPPRFVLAHSAGALVILLHLQQAQMTLDGLILSGPFLIKRDPVRGLKLLLAHLLSLVTPHRLLPNSGVAHLTRDLSVQAEIAADPLEVQSATPRWFTEALKAQRAVWRDIDKLTVPLLILQGGADQSSDPDGSQRLFDEVGSTDKQIRVYPELYHEVLKELPEDREVVYRDLLEWIAPRMTSSNRAGSG